MLQSDGPDGDARWVVLLAQLPASPSSPRVTLWRRARAAGAAGPQNGVWVLPRTTEHAALFDRLATMVREQGGSGLVLTVTALDEATDAEIVAQFRTDRAREYDEFAERCAGVLAEIDKERARSKFTFAELEEIEGDLDKLTGWLGKISARDFFPTERAAAAADTLRVCQDALAAFARAVYDAEGLSTDDATAGPTALETGEGQ